VVISTYWFLLSAFIGMMVAGSAWPQTESVVSAAQSLSRIAPAAVFEFDGKTGLTRSIHQLSPQTVLQPKTNIDLKEVDRIVLEFFSSNKMLFVEESQILALRVITREVDPLIGNRVISRVRQIVNDVEVYGAEAVVGVNLETKSVDAVTAKFSTVRELGKDAISPEEARVLAEKAYRAAIDRPTIAVTEIAIAGAKPVPLIRLVIFDSLLFNLDAGPPQLAWFVKIGTYVFFVDAAGKTIIHSFRDLPSAKVRSTYDLSNGKDLPGVLVVEDARVVSGVAISADARLAHQAAGQTYDYYLKHFGRDSFDRASKSGAPLISAVRFGHLDNSYWDPAAKRAVYGPDYGKAIELVGHEITHGLVKAETGIEYFGQSGAVDEALADFFGAMIAASVTKTFSWAIGSDLPNYSKNYPLRSMNNPHNGGFVRTEACSQKNFGRPDHLSEMVSQVDRICSSTTDYDYQCVHFNSGILSKAFFLASEGGESSNGGAAVQKIGLEKLQHILYRSITAEFLTSSVQFSEFSSGTVKACQFLFKLKISGIVQTDCEQLQQAYRAVGIF
jgi:Zn-dependent metalloprotease